MAESSKIEWTDTTWNVATGCTRISEACDHCYIERTIPFRMAGRRFDSPKIGGTTGVTLHPNRLEMPLRWRKPRRVFVNSLADLFHEEIPDKFIAEVFAVMALTPQHTYQVLTKRPARMRSLLNSEAFRELVFLSNNLDQGDVLGDLWPLPNVWIGCSVENQKWADIRVPALLHTPAAVRFLSCEPLLGPVKLPFLEETDKCNCAGGTPESSYMHERMCDYEPGPAWGALHWVIVGGESGPGARPMHPDWSRSLRDQCQTAGVPYFFKQWGKWMPVAKGNEGSAPFIIVPEYAHGQDGPFHRGWTMRRASKKTADRQLDGREWSEYPQAVTQ